MDESPNELDVTIGRLLSSECMSDGQYTLQILFAHGGASKHCPLCTMYISIPSHFKGILLNKKCHNFRNFSSGGNLWFSITVDLILLNYNVFDVFQTQKNTVTYFNFVAQN